MVRAGSRSGKKGLLQKMAAEVSPLFRYAKSLQDTDFTRTEPTMGVFAIPMEVPLSQAATPSAEEVVPMPEIVTPYEKTVADFNTTFSEIYGDGGSKEQQESIKAAQHGLAKLGLPCSSLEEIRESLWSLKEASVPKKEPARTVKDSPAMEKFKYYSLDALNKKEVEIQRELRDISEMRLDVGNSDGYLEREAAVFTKELLAVQKERDKLQQVEFRKSIANMAEATQAANTLGNFLAQKQAQQANEISHFHGLLYLKDAMRMRDETERLLQSAQLSIAHDEAEATMLDKITLCERLNHRFETLDKTIEQLKKELLS